jgi:hypothetical protein
MEHDATRIVESGDVVPKEIMEKMDMFADDLGLPAVGSQLRHDIEDKTPAQRKEDEEALDRIMGRIAGEPSMDTNAMDGIMDKMFAQSPPPPPRSRAAAPPMFHDRLPAVAQVDRSDLTQRIIFNVEHFGPHLRTITGESKEAFIQSLGGRDGQELQGLLTTIERTRSVGNLATGFKQMFYVVGQAVETGTRVIGMKTGGFTEQLKEQDEEITMCLKEIAINEWERLKAFDSPQIRLGSLFCMTLMQTDARNRMGDQLRRVVQAPVNANVAQANEDL